MTDKIEEESVGPKRRDILEKEENYNKRLQSPVKFLLGVLWILLLSIPYYLCDLVKCLISEKKSIRDKLCVITGTGRGLGREIALRFGQGGAKVVCLDINEASNEETVRMIKSSGGYARGYTLNVAKAEDVNTLAERIQEELGPVDILVNNAGLVMAFTIDQWNKEEVTAMFNVNILSHYWMIQAFLPKMRARNEGHIVAMSSISALVPSVGLTVYGAAKAAIVRMMDLVKIETSYMNRDNKIKFTTICPFLINTSADYNKWYKARFPIVGMRKAIDEIMDSILYEKSLTTVPGMMIHLSRIMRLLPFESLMMILDLIGLEISTPDKAERNELIYHDIVDECQ